MPTEIIGSGKWGLLMPAVGFFNYKLMNSEVLSLEKKKEQNQQQQKVCERKLCDHNFKLLHKETLWQIKFACV